MDASHKQVSEDRKLLANPYAHLDGNGGYAASSRDARSGATVGVSLENPYVYAQDCEADDQVSVSAPQLKPSENRSSDPRIVSKVSELQRQIWVNRRDIWKGRIPTDPVELLDPAVALNLLGFSFEEVESLGQHRVAGQTIEVAGVVDSKAKTVRISHRFGPEFRRFTAAHELGHASLHKSAGLHRDRALNGASPSRDLLEREADRFATLFLMPENLLKTRFKQIFRTSKFTLNEDSAYALAGNDSKRLLAGQIRTRRDLSRLLARTKRYDNRIIISLAEQFRVSIEAMAIRIEELDLLA